MIDVIDTHLHFWNLEQRRYPWLEADQWKDLRATFEPKQFEEMAPNVLASVHVQAEMDHDLDPVEETEWLASLRRETDPTRPVPTVAVGYADLTSEKLSDVLDRHQAYDFFRGIRQEAWYEADSATPELQHHFDLMSHPGWVGGLRELAGRGLSFDLLVYAHQLRQAADTFAQVPELPVVLDHLAQPTTAVDYETWKRDVRYFIERVPNAYVKLSGFWAIADSFEDPTARNYILDTLEIFGPERSMVGSNFPVDKALGSYSDLWNTFDGMTSDLGEDVRSKIFVDTAASFYRIDLTNPNDRPE